MKQDMIAVVDLGRDGNSALARKIRELGVYSEIHPHDLTARAYNALPSIKGIIFNGDPEVTGARLGLDIIGEAKASGIPFTALPEYCEADNSSDKFTDELSIFVFGAAKCGKNWNMKNFIDDQVELLRAQIGDGKVLLALSGGVDSSVVAALLIKAIGSRLTCVHVNHGLLRKGEPEQVVKVFREQLGAELIYVDAVDRFLGLLENVSDPEQKRKIIGGEFIKVFAEEAAKLTGIKFLGQGTIYPDIAESGTKLGKAVKAHHNVGGLPKELNFELVEPLKYLYKDEVREVGRALGLPDSMVYRQPFPGPGLGVRCLGAITRDRLEAVRKSDAILREEFENARLAGKVWQYFTLIPDIKSVGVRDNARSFEWPVIIRAVNTVDAMTAEIEPIEYAVLNRVVRRIITEVKGVNRVCYDLTPKPTGTIEWE